MNIGVFDSGRGGKLIADKIAHALPQHHIIFKSDPQYFPYGNKTAALIEKRVAHFAKEFTRLNCPIVVIACNSATTNVIATARKQFPRLTFVGVEPPIKPAAKLTHTGKIAIMGTTATINSQRQQYLAATFGRKLKVFAIPCPGLAEAIETDPCPSPATAKLLHRFLDQPIATGVDVVGLACTHYPYLLNQMHALFPDVIFYDPADAVVHQVLKLT